jgi:serine/threonine-protein kinase
VFRTYEPTRDRLVAVKVFRLDVIPEQAQALADELARAADAGLFHPSIVEPIAAGVEGTVAYRAEEYVAAESLDVAMRHYAPAPLDKALPFITQLAGAIDFARAAGVGHGALHPRDIFVTPDEARATGFGVVEALERVGLRAPVRRPYSPPERIAGEAWSTPADVFSLAAIAYELLTGARPSGTGEHIGSLDGSRAGEHADRLHAVLARAMHDEPRRRYPTALGFAAALEAAAAPASDAAAQGAAARGSDGSGGSSGSEVLSGSPGSVVPVPVVPVPDVPVPEVRVPEAPSGYREPREPKEPKRTPAPREPKEPKRTPEPVEPPEPQEPHVVDSMALGPEEDEPQYPLMREPPDLLALDDEIRDGEPAAADFAGAEDPRGFESIEEELREHPGLAAASGVSPAAGPTVFAGAIADGERRGSDMLPRAIFLIVGLLVGFLAGNFVAGRDGSAPAEPAVTSAQPESPGTAGASAQQGKAWSDQPVTQKPPSAQPGRTPAGPPPIPGETAAPPARTSTPAAAAATSGTIVVRSTPSGAGVTINNTWRGRTPLTLTDLRFGSYTVRVVQPGYTVVSDEVRLSTREPSHTMSVQLQRSPSAARPAEPPASRPAARTPVGAGSVYVNSRPPGARVFLNGKPVGVTPLRLGDVRAGSHTIRMELADHRTWIDTKYVLAGQETTFTGSLERIR